MYQEVCFNRWTEAGGAGNVGHSLSPPSHFMLATGLKDIDSERKKTKLGYFVERVHLSVMFCFILNPEKNIDINNMTLLMNTM